MNKYSSDAQYICIYQTSPLNHQSSKVQVGHVYYHVHDNKQHFSLKKANGAKGLVVYVRPEDSGDEK